LGQGVNLFSAPLKLEQIKLERFSSQLFSAKFNICELVLEPTLIMGHLKDSVVGSCLIIKH
jgi:hypothetical protein